MYNAVHSKRKTNVDEENSEKEIENQDEVKEKKGGKEKKYTLYGQNIVFDPSQEESHRYSTQGSQVLSKKGNLSCRIAEKAFIHLSWSMSTWPSNVAFMFFEENPADKKKCKGRVKFLFTDDYHHPLTNIV